MTLADQLLEGSIGLADLWRDHPAAFALYVLAYDDGRASRQAEVDQAEHEADRLYRFAFGQGQRQQLVDELLDREQVTAYRRTVRNRTAA
jgi:hypothetical protein